ncbi:MAG: hypothetical protein J5642_06560 [Bacteroidales bacterium]|nr:hypothetical protein [Bacteroidales bacterium]
MSETLYLFNPDHDLALAHGVHHYVPPRSALEFRNDAATLPIWTGGSVVLVSGEMDSPDFLQMCRLFGLSPAFVTESQLGTLPVGEVRPWGWNHNLRAQLLGWGMEPAVLPGTETLNGIRRLSHRRTAMDAMEFVRERISSPQQLPLSAVELTDMGQVERFVEDHGEVVLKMPWSGSGRGLRRVFHHLTPHQAGWAAHSIRSSGCVMGEPFYRVVQDFAMEFQCRQQVEFCGYSLFKTQNGVYQENILLPDGGIVNELSHWLDPKLIEETKVLMTDFLTQKALPWYQGPLGVDMFVYQMGNQYFLNPAVEINFRMTMGMLSSLFVRNFMAEECHGQLKVTFAPVPGDLLKEHTELARRFPPRIQDGRLVSGYLSLTPVTPQTRYAVRVISAPCSGK